MDSFERGQVEWGMRGPIGIRRENKKSVLAKDLCGQRKRLFQKQETAHISVGVHCLRMLPILVLWTGAPAETSRPGPDTWRDPSPTELKNWT